jgi:hypothetical protein
MGARSRQVRSYDHTSIGDVGYIRDGDGYFMRMFNVLSSCEFLFELKLVKLELYDHMKVNDDLFRNIRPSIFLPHHCLIRCTSLKRYCCQVCMQEEVWVHFWTFPVVASAQTLFVQKRLKYIRRDHKVRARTREAPGRRAHGRHHFRLWMYCWLPHGQLLCFLGSEDFFEIQST